MSTYISIDVAVRSLAIGVYVMKPFTNIDALRDDDPITMNSNIDSMIQPILMRVIDINNNLKTKETSIATKAAALKQVLTAIDLELEDVDAIDTTVLIEYQMNANHGANAIMNMLVYHYAGRYPIKIVVPSWKNTITIYPKLSLAAFLGFSSSNYKANKNHARYTMIYFLTAIDRLDAIEGIANKNQDDIADTLCQAMSYHMRF